MPLKKSKRNNIDKEVCPVPKKSNKTDRSNRCLQERIVHSDDVNKLLSTQTLVLIKGPICCGKSYCAQEVAISRKLPMKVFQINDDLDSRTIFGCYSCTDVPGEFIWQPSLFSKCLKEKCIILLRAFDSAHVDLVAAILALAETRCFKEQGEMCQVNEECRIIATLKPDSSLNLLCDYPYVVSLKAFTIEEHSKILTMRFPQLDMIKDKLLAIFYDVCALIKSTSSAKSDRELNSIDLFRLCKRLHSFTKLSDNKLLLHEFLDVWVQHLANAEQKMKVAQVVAEALSITEQELSFIIKIRKPDIALEENMVIIGRTRLSRQLKHTKQSNSYGLTRGYSQLMEKIATCISNDKERESVLLSGETGVGKTSVIQLLASYVGASLKVVNMSQDSEYSDLIGGYKPVSLLTIVQPLADDYFRLFQKYFNVTKNQKFLDHVKSCLSSDDFETFLQLVIGSVKSSVSSKETAFSLKEWNEIGERAVRLSKCFGDGNKLPAVPFAYVQGIISKAAAEGDWLLIDEINLASPECLDAIVQVLDNAIKVDPKFRLFACMNPATDVGKKYLPLSIRSKFTEFFVQDTSEIEELAIIVKNYLKEVDSVRLNSILEFYREVCEELPRKYSLRTLCRALALASDNIQGHFLQSLVSGLTISFTSNLTTEEQIKLSFIISKHFEKLPDRKSVDFSRKPEQKQFVAVEGSYIKKGALEIKRDSKYVFTPSVRANLAFLASVVSTGRFPILLEGETSAGKTSIILHLAKISGNQVHRINNHEQTDVQEYLGNYSPNKEGRLEFKEGVLLRAVRNGDWIILDELNLAPPAVLEALNRLLDDNREIFIPELNLAIPAHQRFQLFATQNPVGSYAGRKRLSRAFLNRFVIIKYDHIPFHELPQIVQNKCGVSQSMAEKMIEVLGELKARRSVSGIFSLSSGLMTLRDLFRWGNRAAMVKEDCYDWRQTLADQGYFVLGSRCRSAEDERTVVEVLEKQLKRIIDVKTLFSYQSKYFPKEVLARCNSSQIVLNYPMCRMLILVSEAWKCNEAVLLVGSTGCGKTTAAHILEGALLSINCNERTETSDFLGSIRPATGGLFQWTDGVVLQAMKLGKKLLIDEISLAPDSVLERLNSLLEPERSILPMDTANVEVVKASVDFQILATMNPSGDHGKKELSKALRNRFHEVWCPSVNLSSDIKQIIEKRISSISFQQAEEVANCFVQFIEIFTKKNGHLFRSALTTRDFICMAEMFKNLVDAKISIGEAILHAVSAHVFDAIGILPSRILFDRNIVTQNCLHDLCEIVKNSSFIYNDRENLKEPIKIIWTEHALQVGEFTLPYGPLLPEKHGSFSFDAPTAKKNAFRVARALVSSKPVMLEGSPGAGKSSLIVALAKATGNALVRLNLSEQTDLCDLFGSDVPVISKDGKTSFAWKDGPVLTAIKENAWVLLDEMNLASQPVLEGLNSCFDFRKNLFVSQLNKTFEIEQSKCRFFGCQNPRNQGGDRKSLPKSFLNRFTSIYVEEMCSKDFIIVLQQHFGEFLSEKNIDNMVAINEAVCKHDIKEGGPFEFNLRDLLRWASAAKEFDLRFGFEIVYIRRLRKQEDIKSIIEIFNQFFGLDYEFFSALSLPSISGKYMRFGVARLSLENEMVLTKKSFYLLASQSKVLQQLIACVHLNWLSLVTGSCNSGKRSIIEFLAMLSNQHLRIMRLTSETDAMELLGSYEQVSTLTADGTRNIQFQWLNSEFVDAYMYGKWILIEDVNSCSAAVLDCLNSCLEDGGHLIVPGHSADDGNRINKHKNFRIFFTMDPKNGKLSRAMRNRSVELFLVEELQWNKNSSDAVSVVFREFQQALKDNGRGEIKWISNSSPIELLRSSAMVSLRDIKARSSTVDNCMMLIPRPLINEKLRNARKLSECLSKYYQLCWEEVARISTDPIPEFVFSMLSSSANESQNFSVLDQKTVSDVKRFVQDAMFYASNDQSFDIQKLFEISPSLPIVSSESSPIDFLRLLRSIRKTAISERFVQMFPSEQSLQMQQAFSEVMNRYQMCGPFRSLQDYELFVENCIASSAPLNEHSFNSISLFAADFNEFAKTLLSLCKGSACSLDYERLSLFQRYIQWNSEDAYEAYSVLEIMNSCCNFHTSFKTNMLEFISIPCFETIIATKFWSLHGSQMMPLNKVKESGSLLNSLSSAFWVLTFLKNEIQEKKRLRMAELNRFFNGEYLVNDTHAIPSLNDVIKISILLLKTLTPPLSLIDPVIAEKVQSEYYTESLHIVEIYFCSIRNFLILTAGNFDEVFLEQRANPTLNSLHAAKQDALSSLAKLSNTFSNSTFYRPSAKNFSELVEFLNTFVENMEKSLTTLLQENFSTICDFCCGANRKIDSNIALLPAQLTVFLQTCQSFKQQLKKKFFAFVDITTIFLSALNMLLLGVNRVLLTLTEEFRKRQLISKEEFLKVSLDLRDKSIGKEILRLAIGASCILPPELQFESVLCHLQHCSDISTDLVKWIESKWCFWYQRNSAKKNSLYVYKSRIDGSGENEKVVTDPDELELRQYLPDFGEDEDEERDNSISAEMNSLASCELSANQIVTILLSLLCVGNPTNEHHEHEKISYQSLMRILDKVQCYENLHSSSILLNYFHLIYIKKAENLLEGSSEPRRSLINVYAEGDRTESNRAITAIFELRNRASVLHEEFPENVILSELIYKIDEFCNVNASTSLMKLAVMLERVLAQANEWQSLADSTRSIQSQMLTLQEILLHWRKLEVLCWSEIIKRMEKDFEQVAILSSWPIFETLDTLPSSTSEIGLVGNDEKIVLMVIEWIHNSSLADFSARLKSAELLAQFVKLKSRRSDKNSSKFTSGLAMRITSVIRHFTTFSGALYERLAKVKADVQQQLNNFVDIFKYNDLNIWSIKQSSQKAHTQLSKIIKLFKENCREPVQHLLLDKIPVLPVLPSLLSPVIPKLSSSSKFGVIIEKLQDVFSSSIDHNALERLQEQAVSFLSLINQDVSYDGFDDETNEKLQGRALFERQKLFAFLIRSFAQIGLSSRRGLQICSEDLTIMAMTNVFVEHEDIGHGLRFSVVARNVFLKKYAATKLHQQEHLQKQVPVHVLTHLKGITEFGLHWIVSAAQLLVNKILLQKQCLEEICGCFKMVMYDYKSSADLDYQLAAQFYNENTVDLQTMAYWIDILKQVVLCCPKEKSSLFPFTAHLSDLAEEISVNSLAVLTKQSNEYEKLMQSIDLVNMSLARLKTAHDKCCPNRFGLSSANEVQEYKKVCLTELADISRLVSIISQNFPSECNELSKICVNWIQRMQCLSSSNCDQPYFDVGEEKITDTLLKVQHLVYGLLRVIDRDESKKLKAMDAVKEIIQLFNRFDIEKVTSDSSHFLIQISSSKIKTSYEAIKIAYEFSDDLHAILGLAAGWLSLFLKIVSSCYINFEAIACRILTDGFVNPIPKMQDGSSEKTKEMNEKTDNCGMGEGTGGEENVTDQIESTSQIEGLKEGDKNDDSNDQKNESPDDESQPIEMDDDFAASLEDIDGEINDNGAEQEKESFENEVDWDKGQVEEADEQQLDPKLWDKPTAEEPKETESSQDDIQGNTELDVEGDDKIGENPADEGTVHEEVVDKIKGVDDELKDDSVAGSEEAKLLEEDSLMETDDGSNSPSETQLDQDVDANFDADDQAEGDGTECESQDQENMVDQLEDSNFNKKDIEKTVSVSQVTDQVFGVADGTAQDQSLQSEEKGLGEGRPTETEGDGTSNDKFSQSRNEKNDHKNLPHEKSQHEELKIERLLSENTSSVREEEKALGGGEDDDEGEALSYYQSLLEQQERCVVQNSSVEESSKTRELIQRRPKQVTNDTGKAKNAEDNLSTNQETQEQPLSFSRHEKLSENTVSIKFDASCQFDTATSHTLRLQENFEDLNIHKTEEFSSLELKWSFISESVSTLSSTLAENLRMIIEPTIASRLEGDYRTGKRLNVRRLISYIASDYRKDRIWMRRTKKVKRNYQICIAVDDSASMKDNLMTEVTCYGVCLIEKAFRELEVGQLSICKFGKTVKVITNFSAEASCVDGANLLSELSFKQDKTDLENLLIVTGDSFLQARQNFHASDQMLIILSDGRGVMSDGLNKIQYALNRLIEEQVTVLFLIVDNGEKSIMDVKVAKFTADGKVLFESYMDKFPFPFFAIVNEVSMLPSTIAEAIRQWFEFTCR